MGSKEVAATQSGARSSNSSFCIDALLARQDPVHSSCSPSSGSDSGHTSPRIVSPSSRPSSCSPSHLDESQRPLSPIWHRPPSSQCLTSMVMGHQSEIFSSAPSPLYAAMYGSAGQRSNMQLLQHSAFHSPLHDLKAHSASSGLSMDWLARAGLLYHRTPGELIQPQSAAGFVTQTHKLLRVNCVFFLKFLLEDS